jgi:hypothetical protein
MSKKQSIVLAASAGFFATLTAFVGIPIIIYAANPGEFTSPLLNIMGTYWVAAAVFFALLAVPPVLLPGRGARVWSALAAVVAIYIWAHGVFQSHSFGAIDGQSWSAAVPKLHIAIEVAVILGGIVVIFLAALRLQKMLAIFLMLLSAGILFQSWPTLSASKWLSLTDDVQLPKIAEFSDKGNALVVLMDTMVSDVFEEVVSKNPDIAKALEGFIFYPDTVGASPTTFLAMPTIHSGQPYRGGQPTAQFFNETVKKHSVLTKVADAGYRSILVNPIQGICPDKVECLLADAAMRSKKSVARSEGLSLLDAMLFRLAPLGLKNATYNDGEWILQSLLEDERFIQRAMKDNFFLQDLATAMTVSAGAPTLKFLHLMNTHPPYVFDQTCNYAGRQQDRTRENFSIQVKCSLDSFVKLLDALKARNLYDQTAIILLADHGNYGLESTRTSITGSRAKLVGAANPTFAIKPVGSKGAFRTGGGEIYIGDFGATLCDLLKACSTEFGISALSEPYGRTRLFNYYRWKNEFWRASTIAGLTPYEIRGPVGRKDNWIKDAPVKVGQTIDFSEKGNSTAYIWTGFSQPEPWGTWTDGAIATLVMNPDKRLPGRITLQLQGFVEPGPVHATVMINEKKVGQIELNKSKPAGEFSFRIPDEIPEDGSLKLDLVIAEPKSPKELGLSNDDRKLAIGLYSMRIDAAASGASN